MIFFGKSVMSKKIIITQFMLILKQLYHQSISQLWRRTEIDWYSEYCSLIWLLCSEQGQRSLNSFWVLIRNAMAKLKTPWIPLYFSKNVTLGRKFLVAKKCHVTGISENLWDFLIFSFRLNGLSKEESLLVYKKSSVLHL